MHRLIPFLLCALAGSTLSAVTYTATPNTAIPDNDPNGVTSTLTVPATADRIRGLRVGLRLNHTYDGDLDIFLLPPGVTWAPPYAAINNGPVVTPPAGVIQLSTNNGGANNDYGTGTGGGTVYTNFRSSRDPISAATANIRTGAAPFTSQTRWIPEGEAEYDHWYGRNPSGNWTLIVVDGWAVDTGTLVSWQLEYDPVASPSLIARLSDANAPGANVTAGAVNQVLGHFEFEARGALTFNNVRVSSENAVVLNTSFSRIALHEDLNANGVLDVGEGPTLTGTLTAGSTNTLLSFGAGQAMANGQVRRFLLVGDALASPAATGIKMQVALATDVGVTGPAAVFGLFALKAGFHPFGTARTFTSAPATPRYIANSAEYGVRDTIKIPATDDRIAALRVGVRIEHNRDLDVDIWLLPPGVDWTGPYIGGTPPPGAIELSTDNGGNNADYGTGNGPYVYTFFSGSADPVWPAGTAINAGAAPFTGAAQYRPEDLTDWNVLYGRAPTGDWTLVVVDDATTAGNSGGYLLSWTVQYRAHPKAVLGGNPDFGSTSVGVVSPTSPRTLTVTNSGDLPLSISAASFAGNNPGDFTFTPALALPINVAAGATANLPVSFTPAASGVRSAQLRITSNSGGVAGTVASMFVYGFATMPAELRLRVGFANQPGTALKKSSTNNVVGQYEISAGSAAATVNSITIRESAGRVLASNLTALRLYHDADNDGVLDGTDPLLATAPLVPGQTFITFNVSRAFAAQTYEHWLLVADVAAAPANTAVAFQVAAAADVSATMAVTGTFPVDTGPHPLDGQRVFTNTPSGGVAIPNASTAGITSTITIPATTETVAALRVGIRILHPNAQDLDIFLIPPGVTWAGPYTEPAPAGVTLLSSDNGGNNPDYGIGASDFVYTNFTGTADPVFTPSTAITAGTAPFIAGYYRPEGSINGRYNLSPAGNWTLAVVDDAGSAFSTGRLLSWQIEYLPPGTPEVSGVASFGNSNVGVVSATSPITYTITNIGGSPLTITDINLIGANPADFLFPGGIGVPNTLAPGAQRTLQVSFQPTALGARNANIEVVYNTGTSTGLTRTYAISGFGTRGLLSVTSPVNYGGGPVGQPSSLSPQLHTLTNTGDGPLTVTAIALAGAQAANWSLSGLPSLPAVIAPGGNVSFSGTLTPGFLGAHAALLNITSDTGTVVGTVTPISLTGLGAMGIIGVTTPVNYGSSNVGTATAPVNHTINNTGNAALVITSIAMSGANAVDWTLTLPAFPLVIGAGGSANIPAVFTPGAAGARSATLDVLSDTSGVPGTLTQIAVSGFGTVPVLSVTSPVNYGQAPVGQATAPVLHTVSNTGDGPLTITAIALGGAQAANWSLSGLPALPAVVAPGGSINFSGTLTPGFLGAHAASINVTSNTGAAPGTVTGIAVTGLGANGVISFTTPVSYGGANVGSSATPVNHTISNTGNDPLTITAIALAGANPGDWALSGLPALPVVIAAGGSISITGTFTPTALGARSAAIAITSNTGGVAGTVSNLAVTGTGTRGLIGVTSPVNYGSGNVGVASSLSPRTHTINNTGNGPLTITAINITGAQAGAWSFTGLPALPVVIAAGGNISFQGSLTVAVVGANTATIEVTSNSNNIPGTVTSITLNGNGTRGILSTSAGPVDYGSGNIGALSTQSPKNHNVANLGDGPLTVTSATFIAGGAEWTLTSPATFPRVIGVGASLNFIAELRPAALGARSGTLRLVSDSNGVAGTNTDIAVTGTGTEPLISVTTPRDYGAGLIGTASANSPLAHAIANTGTGPLTIASISLTGPDAADWTLSGLPGFPAAVAAGGTLNFSGTLVPAVAGARNAIIRITSNTGNVPGTTTDIAIFGTGTPPTSVAGVTATPDAGGPQRIEFNVSGPVGGFLDLVVTYTGGLNNGPPVITSATAGTVVGNVIQNVPANSTVSFVWDAYATERHTTASNYVITVTPWLGATPGTPGNYGPFTLQREDGWAQHVIPGVGATAVYGHSAVFDDANDRLVVFGGRRGGTRSNELWMYERGSTYGPGWRRVVASGTAPSARQYHAVLLDTQNNRMIVHGGYGDSGYLSDTWALSLNRGSETWTQLFPGSPTARYSPVFVYDNNPGAPRALMIGGYASTGALADAWELSLAAGSETFTNITAGMGGSVPSARWGGAGAITAARDRLVMYGGFAAGAASDQVYELNLGTMTWTLITPTGTAGTRYYATWAYDSAGDTLVVQSGYRGSTLLRDTWRLELSGGSAYTWTELPGDSSAGTGRVVGAAAYDVGRNEAAFYGGLGSGGIVTNSLSFLTLAGSPAYASLATRAEAAGPEGRWGAVSVYDEAHSRVVVYGGKDNTAWFGDVWILDTTVPGGAWSRLPLAGPTPPSRVYASAAYDAAANRMIVFGGSSPSAPLADIWILDLANPAQGVWSQVPLAAGPAPRMLSSLVYDSANNRAFIYGGTGSPSYMADAWMADLTAGTWTVLTQGGTAPAARYGHAASFDSANQRMVLVGGRTSAGNQNDIHALDLSAPLGTCNWSGLGAVAPLMPARNSMAFAATANGQTLFLHGGDGSTILEDLWRLDVGPVSATWTQLVAPGGAPVNRKNHIAALTSTGRLYLGFGFYDNRAAADIWSLDTGAVGNGWATAWQPAEPTASVAAAVALDPLNRRLISFGGLNGGVHDPSVFVLDLAAPVAQWQRLNVLAGPAPAARRSATMVYDGSHVPPRMIMYGGRVGAAASTISGELWALELTPGAEQWVQLSPLIVNDPGKRAHHCAAVDGAGRMIVFGGSNDFGIYVNTVHALDLATLTWTQLTPAGTAPAARMGASAIYDPVGDRMLVFGGVSGGTRFNAVEVLSLGGAPAWSVMATGGTAPPTMYYHSAVYDSTPGAPRMLVYGGYTSTASAGIYQLDLLTNQWAQLGGTIAQPQERWAHGAAWDAPGNRMVVTGGYLNGEVAATQENGTVAEVWFFGG